MVREEAKGPQAGQLAAIYFGRCPRGESSLTSDHPGEAAEYAIDVMVEIGGRTNEVLPIDLRDTPHLQAALDLDIAREVAGGAGSLLQSAEAPNSGGK